MEIIDNKKLVAIIALFVLFVIPYFWVSGYHLYLFSLTLLSSIVCVATWLLVFRTGQLVYAFGVFFGMGGYITALLLSEGIVTSLWLAILIGAVGTMILGTVVCLPGLRVRGFYLAILSLALSSVFVIVLRAFWEITKGTEGLYVNTFPSLSLGFTKISFISPQNVYFLNLAVAAVSIFCLYKIAYSRTGKIFRLIGENEDLAKSLGINTVSYKIKAFLVTTFFAGVAGAFYAPTVGHIMPGEFGVIKSLYFVFAPWIGGVGSVLGAFVGSWLLFYLPEFFRVLPVAGVQRLVAAILFIASMILFRGGIVKTIKEHL